MRVLIIGAGNAGQQLAMRLCEEKHSVVMVDANPQVLAEAEAKLDILTVCGPGSSPRVLDEAQVFAEFLFKRRDADCFHVYKVTTVWT